ncbi:MAG TPA: ketol-acid reductoisomerase, partial [Dehalococcoidia bacterium]|nr:ketol-acid reductoisomerase [Dehalococcoidia bacterium]
MAKVYYDRDADLSHLKGKLIAIVGYGSQGHAHAQNLRDSGYDVIVASRPGGTGWKAAEADGFRVLTVADATKEADIITMLAPDNQHARIYTESVEPNLTAGKTLMFAHGFNVHFFQVIPPTNVDVSMVAPKCPGHMLRALYKENAGPPAILAVHQDVSGKAREVALAYASALGCARAGVIETT